MSQPDLDLMGDPSGPPASDPQPPVLKAPKGTPQEIIDEFWKKFNTKFPGKPSTVLPDDRYAQRAAASVPHGSIPGQNAEGTFEQAAAVCRSKVEKIAKECRRVNQKYRDPTFDLEFDLRFRRLYCLNGLIDCGAFDPQSVKRVTDIFDEPKFFIDGASAGDIRQGRDGNCWFLAALCTLSNKPGLIPKICVAADEAVGVYGFVFHRDGGWVSTIIDDKLYLTKSDYDENFWERFDWDDNRRPDSEEEFRKAFQTGSGALYFAQCCDPNETWLPLLEKAYAKAHGDFLSIEGGFVGEAIEDLTGGVTTELFTTDILDKEKFWKEELLHVNETFLFGCATGFFGGRGERKGIIEGHAYSIMKAVEVKGERLLLLRNPWGDTEWRGAWSDGSKEWTPEWMQLLNHRFGDDGTFWMSYKDLLRKFQHFDRTRLFGPGWSITQQWTMLHVPWSVDYHDTKFKVTIQKAGPVVFVLSQLDSRYFRGLDGQYTFQLQFRINKEGSSDYIVRSHGNYFMERSVSAEIDLEPGAYSVLIKITATRDLERLAPDAVIRQTVKDKRDKLLQIGISYDLAHARVLVKESDEEIKERERKEKLKKRAEEKKRLLAKAKSRKRKEWERAKKQKKKEQEKAKKKAEKQKQKGKEKIAGQGSIPATNGTMREEVAGDLVEVKPGGQNGVIKSPADTDLEAFKRETPKKVDEPTDSQQQQSCEVVPSKGAAKESTEPADDNDSESDYSDLDLDDLDLSDDEDEDEDGTDKTKNDQATADEDMDEFERDPWNAVCVVGLRVYTRDDKAEIEVVRPKPEKENGLDVDDPAVDASRNAEGKVAAGVLDVEKPDEENKNVFPIKTQG